MKPPRSPRTPRNPNTPNVLTGRFWLRRERSAERHAWRFNPSSEIVNYPIQRKILSLLQCFAQQLPQRVERLWNDPRAGQHAHEIGIAVPAWDEVPVKMARQARAGDPAKIEAHVEAFGMQQLAVDPRQPGQLLHALDVFILRHVAQLACVPSRRHEDVAVVVRIAVEDDLRMRTARGHEKTAIDICGVVVLRGCTTQKANAISGGIPFDGLGLRRRVGFAAGNVFETPRCPESVEGHRESD